MNSMQELLFLKIDYMLEILRLEGFMDDSQETAKIIEPVVVEIFQAKDKVDVSNGHFLLALMACLKILVNDFDLHQNGKEEPLIQ